MKHKTPAAKPHDGMPAKPYVRASEPDAHLTQVRTRVPDATYDALVGEAALSGVSLAALVRDILTAHVGSAPVVAVRSSDMTPGEKDAFREWSSAVTDDPNKKAWRGIVDTALRNRGVDLPPLTDEHTGLLAWAAAVHPHTRAADLGPYPPRFPGNPG